jgi:uncharacterized protein YjiS (DUF1127 family)
MMPRPPSAPGILLALAWLAGRRLAQACHRAAEIWLAWSDRSRQRRQLAQLSDHMLRDIGLNRADAWAEADKPFWLP